MKDVEFQPARVLVVSFLAAILVGTVLLSLPFSATGGRTSILDALFTATSAVCVTGLTVIDTPVHYSHVGEAVILFLIQLGGLGIMTFSTLIILAARRRISVRERLLIQSSFHPGIPKDLPSLVRSIFLFTAAIEAAGAAVLFVWFAPTFGASRAVWPAVFHSISAFCNAGFSLFSNNFVGYRGHVGLNLTVAALIVLGGIGFPVLNEARSMLAGRRRGHRSRPSLHFKLVVSTTLVLIAGAAVAIFLLEGRFSMAGLPAGERVLASLFQSITARTAGFNTVDMAALGPASVLLMLFLMFVGASPASTGGGVKTSTAGLLVLLIRARVAARETVSGFRRALPAGLVVRAFTLVALALAVILLASGILLVVQPEIGVREGLFEIFSAFGTVGLSMRVTPALTSLGKVLVCLTMFVGRVGPLTLLYALSRRKARGRFEYAEESLLIG